MDWLFRLPLPLLFTAIVGVFVVLTVTFALLLGRLREEGHRRHPRSRRPTSEPRSGSSTRWC